MTSQYNFQIKKIPCTKVKDDFFHKDQYPLKLLKSFNGQSVEAFVSFDVSIIT